MGDSAFIKIRFQWNSTFKFRFLGTNWRDFTKIYVNLFYQEIKLTDVNWKKLGNCNYIEDVKKYVDEHGYSEELANDELYCFGVEYGDGSDEDNFHFKGIYEHLVRAALITGILLLGLEVKSKLTIRAARIKGGKKID